MKKWKKKRHKRGLVLVARTHRLLLDAIGNDLERHRCLKEAEAMVSDDPFSAHLALGALAALDENLDGVVNHHSEACRLQPARARPYLKQARCLARMGHLTESRASAMNAWKMRPDNAKAMEWIILTSAALGELLEAGRWYGEWLGRFTESKSIHPRFMESVSPWMKQRGITDIMLTTLVATVLAEIHKQEIFKLRLSITFRDEGEGQLLYHWSIPAHRADPAALTERVERLIAMRDPAGSGQGWLRMVIREWSSQDKSVSGIHL
ncbi:MAG: hypothetical protein HQL50_11440 [Magnetococcales bacterium]|nr:hypothetical protein [Magnetococcales bacterium]